MLYEKLKIAMNFWKGKTEPLLPNYKTSTSQNMLAVTFTILPTPTETHEKHVTLILSLPAGQGILWLCLAPQWIGTVVYLAEFILQSPS